MSWVPVWVILGAFAAFVLLALVLAVLERGGDATEDGQEDRRGEGDEP